MSPVSTSVPPTGQVVLAVEPGHYLDLAAVWDTVRNAGFLPDVLMVTAIGRVTEMNGAPALSLSPDFALPLVGEDGLTPLAIEAGDQTVQVTGRWGRAAGQCRTVADRVH